MKEAKKAEKSGRKEQIHLFLTPEQKEEIEKKAKKLGIPVSTYIKVRVFS